MIGILVTGHGNFATGMLSSLKLVAGEAAFVEAVDFLESHSTQDLIEHLLVTIGKLGDEILILTDVKGGSPYNNSVVLKAELSEKHIEVISGTNLPMLIIGVLSREMEGFEGLAKSILSNGCEAIEQFKFRETNKQPYEVLDGI